MECDEVARGIYPITEPGADSITLLLQLRWLTVSLVQLHSTRLDRWITR